jgi:hypothetical protein
MKCFHLLREDKRMMKKGCSTMRICVDYFQSWGSWEKKNKLIKKINKYYKISGL